MTALEWRDLTISYAPRHGESERVVAVDGVSLAVERGSTVGLAGESGCGKSSLAASVLRLLPRSAEITGAVEIDGENVSEMRWGRLRAVRWTEAAIVFQGAMHSLNPVRPVGRQIAEAIDLHRTGAATRTTADDTGRRVVELLESVDLPAARARSYPHELSGGQRQRVMIAMALACDPDLIIADEPTTALDVVIQAQVLDVLTGLVRDRNLTLVMISHDLAVLAAVCERLVVMQDGKIVEDGPARRVLEEPQHPHTRELAAAVPLIGDPAARLRDVVAEPARPDLIEVSDLVVDFRARGQRVRAVDHVSLACPRARSSPWSASPGPARRRSRGPFSVCIRRPRARSGSPAGSCPPDGRSSRPTDGRCSSCSRIRAPR